MEITRASTAEDLAGIREIFIEYARALNLDLGYQGFETELAGLPGAYAPPGGLLLIAREGDALAGCAAFRPFKDDSCEMKRLYVRPEFRKTGLGRSLCEQLIEGAKGAGYRSMLLDTLPPMQGAIRLYESLGFVRRSSYYDTPLAETIFMELRW